MKNIREFLNSFTRPTKDRLFFLEHIDLNNKIVVDFNGDLIKHLVKLNSRRNTFIRLNANFQSNLDFINRKNFRVMTGIVELEAWLFKQRRIKNDKREIVFICSNALNSLSQKYQEHIIGLIQRWGGYYVVHDRIWLEGIMQKPTEVFFSALQQLLKHHDSLQELRDQFLQRGLNLRTAAHVMTDAGENFVDWQMIKNNLTQKYEEIYMDEEVASQVYDKYYYDICWPTHCKGIFRKEG